MLMGVQRVAVQRAQKNELNEMKNMTDFDQIQSVREIMSSTPKSSRRSLRWTAVSIVVQHMARVSVQHSRKHAVCAGSRTTSKWYAGALKGQAQVQPTPKQPRHMNEMHKHEEVNVQNQEEINKRFDIVSMKSLAFHSMKSVIFTKLELNISQRE